MMDGLDVSSWIDTERETTKIPKRIKIRNALAKRGVSRREKSLIPLIDMTTAYVVSGISNDLRASYKDPETRRREKENHAERMRLLHVRLPRLLERVNENRNKRIMIEARHIASIVYQRLKVQMNRTRGINLLLNRANHQRLQQLVPCWVAGFRLRRLVLAIDRILYKPWLLVVLQSWQSTQKKDRLLKRYTYAYIRKNIIVWQKKTTMRCWKDYTQTLRHMHSILRRIGLNNSNVGLALNSWRAYTHQQKEIKTRVRRIMMGLKQAALHSWHDLTKYLIERRLTIYDKFSRRLRHRNLLRPFLTLVQVRRRSLGSKNIQRFVRGNFDRKKYHEKKDKMLKVEMERGKKEREHVAKIEESTRRMLAKKIHPRKKYVMRESIKILFTHVQQRTTEKNKPPSSSPSSSPRSRLLRPLMRSYDLDAAGSISSKQVRRFVQDLGLGGVERKRVEKKNSSRTVSETKLKILLKNTNFERSFACTFRRKIRKITHWSERNAAIGALTDIQIEEARLKATTLFRKSNGKPPIACHACGDGFVLWRSLIQHQSGCLLVARAKRVHGSDERVDQRFNGRNGGPIVIVNTPRVQISQLLKQTLSEET